MLHLIDQVLEWGLKALEENKYYQSDYKELLELRFCHGFQVQVRHFTIWVFIGLLLGPIFNQCLNVAKYYNTQIVTKCFRLPGYWIKIKLLENSFSHQQTNLPVVMLLVIMHYCDGF